MRKLEATAESNFAFEPDNGKPIIRKNGESLGIYLDRYAEKMMKNFSYNKYLKFKSLCDEYNRFGDSAKFFKAEENIKISKENFVDKFTNYIVGIIKVNKQRRMQ